MVKIKIKRRKSRRTQRDAQAPLKKVEKSEVTALGKVIRQLGALGGGTLGSMIGQGTAGSAIGNSLGAAISRWIGAGDYSVSRNVLVERAASGVPMMHKTGQSIVVRHREFVGTITGTSAFTVSQYKINPGLTSTFPWLARLAESFQEYDFRGLVFHYVPTSGMISGGSTALGSVMMQTTYRSNDSAPATKQEMLNEYCANETVPFEPMAHPVECDPKENPFSIHYVRTGTVPAGDNVMLYDIGTLNVATQGNPTNVLGDIYATYEVELKKPVVSSNATQTASVYNAYTVSGTLANPFAGLVASGNLDITTDSSRTISLPRGRTGYYVLIYSLIPMTNFVTPVTWTGATLTNCAAWAYTAAANHAWISVSAGTSVTGEVTSVTGVVYSDPAVTATIQVGVPAATNAISAITLTDRKSVV